jgi:hypothetical protein
MHSGNLSRLARKRLITSWVSRLYTSMPLFPYRLRDERQRTHTIISVSRIRTTIPATPSHTNMAQPLYSRHLDGGSPHHHDYRLGEVQREIDELDYLERASR